MASRPEVGRQAGKRKDKSPSAPVSPPARTPLGFDYFYGFTHARNIGTIIEQDRVVENVAAVDNQPRMIAKAVEWIGKREAGKAFFLYFPMCPPHTPVVPAPGICRQKRREGCGEKGSQIRRLGLSGRPHARTNPRRPREERPRRKHPRHRHRRQRRGRPRLSAAARVEDAASTKAATACPSSPAGREKSNPVPFATHTICLNDLIATCADVVGAKLPDNAGEDSVSILPALLGNRQGAACAKRPSTNRWPATSPSARARGNSSSSRTANANSINLDADLGETKDVADANPEVVGKTDRTDETIRGERPQHTRRKTAR